MRAPKLTLAVALGVLVVLASMLTYATYLVVGVSAYYLGTGRGTTGLLLAILFARFPWVSKGRPRIVGLLPKPARRPFMVSLLALCCAHYLWHGEPLPAVCTGFAMAFLLAFPWLRRAVFDRMVSSVFRSTGQKSAKDVDDNVIDIEFKEKRD
jgi:hypothetical protein